MLVNTIDQVRKVIGNAIRKEEMMGVFRPYLQTAQELIAKLIGEQQLEELQDPGTDEKKKKLLELVERAIVWNGYLDAWFHTFYEQSAKGLMRSAPKDTEQLFRYQEENIRKDIVKKADAAIEGLMEHLEKNQADFPAWMTSGEYRQNFQYLVNGPAELYRSLPEVTKSFRMYMVLRGYMERVELKSAAVIMGGSLFSQLKQKRVDGVALDANWTKLHRLAADYVAPATLLEALPWIRVQFTPDGIRIINVLNNLQDETPVNDGLVAVLTGLLQERVGVTQTALRKFLNETASESVFEDYYNSDLYRVPGSRVWKLPENEGKRHFRM